MGKLSKSILLIRSDSISCKQWAAQGKLMGLAMNIDRPTSDVSSKVLHQRTWLPFGFTSEVIIEGNVKKFRLSEIIDATLTIFSPYLKNELVDLKGCDAGRGELFTAANNQLMHLAGRIPLENKQNEQFTVNLDTPFQEFKGSHHVVHQLQSNISSELLREVPIQKLGRVFPLISEEFRFGIERYKSRRYFSMLGFVPTVNEGFNLEVRAQKARLSLFSEQLKSKQDRLFEGDWFADAVDQLVEAVFGLNDAANPNKKANNIS